MKSVDPVKRNSLHPLKASRKACHCTGTKKNSSQLCKRYILIPPSHPIAQTKNPNSTITKVHCLNHPICHGHRTTRILEFPKPIPLSNCWYWAVTGRFTVIQPYDISCMCNWSTWSFDVVSDFFFHQTFSDCEMFSAYAYHNQLTSLPDIRYQFPLTPTATDISTSPVDSPFLSPAPSILEAARPSITERQHVTSGVCIHLPTIHPSMNVLDWQIFFII